MAQTATILVTDLSGSTETRVTLGEERAEELRRAHDALLAEQASAHGGNVIKGTGDGLIVAFAGTAEALTASVAMQQALATYGRREGIPLAMRVGVSAGDVTFENGDCFGTPVIEASRSCVLAEPSEILVADLVRLLARGRFEEELTSRGPMTLKGLPDAIDVWSVPWEPVANSRGLRTSTPYVGRERELATLRECWYEAIEGRGGLTLIAGEPGIGKTRLVNELCDRIVHPAGGIVLMGGCHDGDVVANTPFVEAFTEWVRRTPPDDVAGALGIEAAVLAVMVPAILDPLPDVGEPLPVPREAEVARLHDAVAQVLLRLGSVAPVALILDDLHWADDATIGMMRAVSRAARSGHVLVIGTYRETDVDRRHPFSQAIAVLQREVEPARIALSGLDQSEVHALLERIAEHDVPEELAVMLSSETEGNPFFLRETLLHLTEEGELRFEDGRWVLAGEMTDLGLPAGVRDVIGRRLSRLPDATNKLLAAGALFEVAFPLPVAADVAGIDEDEALDAIDAALEARIVRATDTFDEYAFTHALFRHALVEELNPSRQVRMHRSIATALEKQVRGLPTPAQAAALARHYQRSAALPNAEQGVPYALIVADDAGRRFALREEYDALGVAIELLPEGDERAHELQRRYAHAALFAGADDAVVLREAELAFAFIAAAEGDGAAADLAAEWARDAWGVEAPWLSWRLAEIGRGYLTHDRRDPTYAILRELELIEREATDPQHPGIPLDTPERRELREIQQSLPPGSARVGPSFFASRADAEQDLERLREGAAGVPLADFMLFGPLWTLGAYAELRQHMQVSADDYRRRGLVAGVVMSLAVSSRAHNVLGAFAEADACLAEGFELFPRISETSNAGLQLFGAVALNDRVRGHMVDVETMDTFNQWDGSPNTRWAWMAVVASRAHALANAGRTDEAMAVLRDSLPVVEGAGGWAQNYPLITDQLAMALWNAQRTDGLEVLERNVRAKVVEPDVRYPEVDGRLTLALLCALTDRTDEATHWFSEARRVLGEQGTWPLLIEVDHAEALMHIRLGPRGDVAYARQLLATARARCTHPALAPWSERLDVRIQALS